MDVAVSDLRANLREWLRRAREGQEVIVTEQGVPVARLVGVETAPLIDRLTAERVIGRPTASERPTATGRPRPRPRQQVAPLVSEQRRCSTRT